jgi:hypothetical protein
MGEERGRVSVTIRFPTETLRVGKQVAEAQRRSFNGLVVTAVERAIAEHIGREARRRREQARGEASDAGRR